MIHFQQSMLALAVEESVVLATELHGPFKN